MKKVFALIAQATSKAVNIRCKVGLSGSGNKVIRVIGITAQDVTQLPLPLQQAVKIAMEEGMDYNIKAPTLENPKGLLSIYEDSGALETADDMESAYLNLK